MFLTCLTAALAASPAPAFTHQGRPIHPQCVTALTGGEPHPEPIQLSTCGKTKEPVEHKAEDFSWTSKEPGGLRPEFASYRVLGQQGGEWVLSWEWGGGGTGIFSGVSLFHLERGALRLVRTVATGDRCNGGLSNSKLEKNVLQYSRSATPSDVLRSVPEGASLDSINGEKLESSALSCFATLDYAGGVLLGAELEDPGSDREGWTDRFPSQACYNALQREFLAKGQTHLDAYGLSKFALAFAQRCLHRDAN